MLSDAHNAKISLHIQISNQYGRQDRPEVMKHINALNCRRDNCRYCNIYNSTAINSDYTTSARIRIHFLHWEAIKGSADALAYTSTMAASFIGTPC